MADARSDDDSRQRAAGGRQWTCFESEGVKALTLFTLDRDVTDPVPVLDCRLPAARCRLFGTSRFNSWIWPAW